MTLLQYAEHGASLGFCLIPPMEDGSKKPEGFWKTYQHHLPSSTDLAHWFTPRRQGVGVIAGAVSHNLEVLDFDRWDIYQTFLARAEATGLRPVVDRIRQGYEEQSPNGAHLLWRCATIAGNTKLAWEADKTLIETRGEGGFCILAPSGGSVHPSGKPYRLLQGGFATVVTITEEERDAILTLCRTFDASPPRPVARPQEHSGGQKNGTRPGDLFAAATPWAEILEPHGWVWLYRYHEVDYWRRPGKAVGTSATTNYAGSDCFYCFTSSTAFDPNRGYGKFSVYALLNYRGDYEAAARSLIAKGFGGAREQAPFPTDTNASPTADPSFSRNGKTTPKYTSGRSAMTMNIVEVREALKHIPPNDRATWLQIGMALASTRHPGAFAIWEEWGQRSEQHEEEDHYHVWESFREQKHNGDGGGVTLGTLYKKAKEGGWDRGVDWSKGLLTTSRGDPVACPANIALILRFTPLWAEQLRFNTFTGQAEYGTALEDEFGRSAGALAWSDTDDAKLADFLRHEYRMAVTNLGHCTQGVELVAREHTYDPIQAWLTSLPAWDGVDRLDHFFADYCQTEFTPYTAFCGRSLFLSLVARAYQPGCQVDSVLVLEGPEGVRKTSLCRLLGGPWYKALSVSFETKDLFLALRRAWIAELAELDAFARSGQARIKSLLTTLVDSYRPAYARHEVDQPRRTVFLGTTNDPVYIVDPYGARRFFPVQVKDIALESIRAVLMQLFAEARDRYHAGEVWWTDDADIREAASVIREQVRETDPWEHTVQQYVEKYQGTFYMSDLFGSACLDIPNERRTRGMQTRIGIILKTLGYVKKRRRNEQGKLEYVYLPET